MGSYAMPPTADDSPSDDDEESSRLGDLLSGRFSDADIDSVEAVRDERERE
ncbi:hypothetical protein MUK72_07015 [Halococcus dombrowskii]|jgi:hypothetical protein|uniref:Uncharacterized protein n=1 Tax=Halococcus dombrowskii TaxID=179637 RepID=A0AAV3SK98_HALDO|nr:hypothetical protein [Halococcus dombrowskii]UOO96448.1 hypothetical protein MUK72_07015 [Halococcus dombrowskii]